MTENIHIKPLPNWPEQITGGKYVRMLEKYAQSLRNADAHGNRRLFLDDVVIAHLLAFFNPTLRSLRTIEDFSQTRQAQRHLSVRRLCKSTLSDFHRIADPALLSPIVERLKAIAAAKGLRSPGPRCPKFSGETSRPLTAEDEAAGVLSDTLGRMAGSRHCPAPDIVLREVIVQSPDEPGGAIRLLTNLLEVEAWAIALLYRYRWQVELFFRWLKIFANFAHLISESRQGILLSFYVAVIGVLLMYLHTGAKPSKYTFSLLGLVANGASTLEEIAPILAERERRIALEAARRARRKENKI